MKSDRSETMQQAQGKVIERSFSRRSLLAGGGALGTALALGAGVAPRAACAAMISTPKRGGTFRVGLDDGNTTDQLDPATTESQYMVSINNGIRNYLTEITEDNVVGPELAEGWEASKDASEWVFSLRKGVEFHNGKPFTAQDAMHSLNYHRGEDSKSAAKPLFAAVEEIKTDGDHRLLMKLKTGNADLPYILSDYHLTMLASDPDGTLDADSGNGTGGYVLKHFEPGVSTQMVRFDNYWKEDRAHFDAIDAIAINDINARMTALESDEVDAISEPDLRTLQLLMRNEELTVDEVPSGTHCTLPMFSDLAPFDNLNVRLALKYAIDREDILQKILNGHGAVGNDHPIGPTLPYWADIPQRVYDPDKAKFHLRKAGMNDLKVELAASDAPFTGAVDLCVLYSEHAKAAGIDIKVVRVPMDGYWSNVWLKKPFCIAIWSARPTPDIIFSLAYSQGADWNESHFKNERFNALLIEARSELDNVKRAELYREMQQIVSDQGSTIIPFFRNRVSARNVRVAHDSKLSGNFPLDGARSFERWWFS